MLLIRFLLAAMTLLCFVMLLFGVFSLNFMATVYALASLAIWGGFLWLSLPKLGFLDWLAQNRKQVEYKSARYKGTPVTLDTVVVRYEVLMAFVHFHALQPTDFVVLGSPWGQATRWGCIAASLLLGWWSIGGLIEMSKVLDRNLKHANSTTVRKLLGVPEKARVAMVGDAPSR